jgi:hypothetical protein
MNVNCWLRMMIEYDECILSVQGKHIKADHNKCIYFQNGSLNKVDEIRNVFVLCIGYKIKWT